MTPEQQKARDGLRRRIIDRGLSAFMSNTKWNRAFEALQSIAGYRARFRTRLVIDQKDPSESWVEGFPFHVPTLSFIEWLEFDPIVRTKRGALLSDIETNFTLEIQRAFLGARIPFSMENGAIRIWGYVQSGSAPKFAEIEP